MSVNKAKEAPKVSKPEVKKPVIKKTEVIKPAKLEKY